MILHGLKVDLQNRCMSISRMYSIDGLYERKWGDWGQTLNLTAPQIAVLTSVMLCQQQIQPWAWFHNRGAHTIINTCLDSGVARFWLPVGPLPSVALCHFRWAAQMDKVWAGSWSIWQHGVRLETCLCWLASLSCAICHAGGKCMEMDNPNTSAV